MAFQLTKAVPKPLLSLSFTEARRRACNLYRAWYREIPHTINVFNLDITAQYARKQLRREFLKNSHIRDARVIDMLVIKGKLELEETMKVWKQKTHILRYFKDTEQQEKKDFLSQFYKGA